MSNKDLLISYKFCGGCNPLYDRGKLHKIIKERLEGKVEIKSKKVLIILNGCNAGCLKSSDYEGSYDRIIDLHDYLILPFAKRSINDIAEWILSKIS